MGIIVQREFTVRRDDRAMFERISREGVWERMRDLGSQMVAFGIWSFGGPGDPVITNSAYVDFDHWTATRPWGTYSSDPTRVAESREAAAIATARPRLIQRSRTHVIEYDDELSEPTPILRKPGEQRSALPPTFGPQSVVSESAFDVAYGARDEFLAISADTIWPWVREEGARVLAVGCDPLKGPDQVTVMLAFRSISEWHRVRGTRSGTRPAEINDALQRRDSHVGAERTRILQITTAFGEPA